MKPQTPQEKKALSYAKDRRNCFGEFNKCRDTIRRRKTKVRKANRRMLNQLLAQPESFQQTELAETVESHLRGKKLKYWHKFPDMRLGDFMSHRLERRKRLGMAQVPHLPKTS